MRNMVTMAAALVLAAAAGAPGGAPSAERVIELPFVPIRLVVAGDPAGTPPDSPDNRVDLNLPSSDWAGVASLFISHDGVYGYICSATPISPHHILSAGHCVDEDDNGTNDFGTNIWIVFNYDGDDSHIIYPDNVAGVYVHPNYTGFNNPNVNDDLVIIELIDPLPEEIPIYPVYRGEQALELEFTTVGYGLSGTGVDGYTVGASFEVKRVGTNVIDDAYDDDEGGPLPEVFAFDFDGPLGSGFWGGPTLGNDIEHTLGGGDSGGPSFVDVDGEWQLATVNTFIFGWNYGGGVVIYPPYFGSGGGGILVNAYIEWIDTFIDPEPGIPGDLDGDDDVDQFDLGILLATYGLFPGDEHYDARGDIDGDGEIGQFDLGILLANYGLLG
ncbi:MAG: trypsin-like serine protease [Phycisphaerales bacterium]|nr:trypsin-like serine protease [Phycisphaerales bacterium]